MIFRPELVRAIVAGKKTQTRRPAKGDDPCRYKLEHSYALQPGRGKPATARILITAVSEKPEAVGDITLKDAMREGFKTTAAFKAYWTRLYDGPWVERQGEDVDDAELVARFMAEHAETPVWVITFELHADPPRFLTPAARPHGSELGYTGNQHVALPDEPEAVDEATLVRFAEAAREREKLRALQGGDDLAERLSRLLDAQARGIDVSRPLAEIKRRIEAAERRVDKAA